MILLTGLFLVSTLVSGSLGELTGSNLSDLQAACENYGANTTLLTKLFLFTVFGHAVTYLSLLFTQNYNAVLTSCAAIMAPIMLIANGENWMGPLVLVGSALFFILCDKALPLITKDNQKSDNTIPVPVFKDGGKKNMLSSVEDGMQQQNGE